jgi:hypothetical protein
MPLRGTHSAVVLRWKSRMRDLVLAMAVLAVGALGCSSGGAHPPAAPDGGADAPMERPEGEPLPPEAGGEDALDADASPDLGETPEVGAEAPVGEGDGGGGDAAVDAVTEHAPDGAPDARAEAAVDLPAERPSATASWTITPNPVCVASGAGCMDTGAVGGYQITASATCPTASSIQLWFPGGAAPIPPGAYAVKPASGILDVISMPAGMVGVLAERDDASTHFRYWGRAGTITVAAAGGARHVTFSGVTAREETTSVLTTVGGDVSCP